MYKSKLQEFCQSKAWLLPEYSTTREGFDHCPRFKASVVVNGATFVTPDFSKSSKEAQNFVAMLAFQHLSGATGASPASPVAATSSTPQLSQPSEPMQATPPNIVNATNDQKHKDMSRLYKTQLQSYAQKRNLSLPVYVAEREGPPHAPRFKCKVTLEGNTYECQEYFCTLKDAENAAAKVALTSVSSVGIEEEDPGVFKNLLQELAQKGYSCLPEYNTTSSGPSHLPLFTSTVMIKGESFVGQTSKTKKLAEMYAAKVAYSALKERKSSQDTKNVFPGSHVDGTSQPFSSSKFQSFPQVEPPQRTVVAPNTGSSTASSEHAMYNQGISPQDTKNVFVGSQVDDTPQPQSSSKFQSFPQVEPPQSIVLPPKLEPNMASSQHFIYNQGAYQKPPEFNHAVTQHEGSQNSVQNASELKPEELPFSRAPSCSPTHPAQSPSSSGLSAYNTPWAGSHASAHKKVKVFPREQNITLPPGAIITHEDEKWIAVAVDSNHGNA